MALSHLHANPSNAVVAIEMEKSTTMTLTDFDPPCM